MVWRWSLLALEGPKALRRLISAGGGGVLTGVPGDQDYWWARRTMLFRVDRFGRQTHRV